MSKKNDNTPRSILSSFLGYRGVLRSMVRRIVPVDDIEDIVQETFIRAHQAEVDRRIGSPEAFMYTTARNLALSFVVKKENSCKVYIEDVEQVEDFSYEDRQSCAIESKEKFRLFCAAVRQLPPQCRRVFIMKRVFGYSIKEISRSLDISESTVEKHIAKGVLRCADFLVAKGYTANKATSLMKVGTSNRKA
jgi:RNA polymerase sigma-70 factor (ECF subfamily)